MPPLRFPTSLRVRLLVALMVVAVSGGVLMAALTAAEITSASDALEDTSMSTQARDLIQGVRYDGAGKVSAVGVSRRWRAAYETAGAAYFTVFDPAGRPIARSANLSAPLVPEPLQPGQAHSPLTLIGPRQDLVMTARAPHGVIVVVSRTNPGALDEAHPDPLADFMPLILLALVAAIGLAVVWILSGWSLRPLRTTLAEAGRIGPEAPEARLSLTGLPEEILPLAKAMNGALDRVSAAYVAERRFTADAAHALRTPVAVMDLRLQRGGDDVLDRDALRDDLRQIARLVSGLLRLARSDFAEQQPSMVNLARLLRETVADLQPAFDANGRSVVVDAPERLEVHAEARGLRDVIEALIDNALCHGAGVVTVRLESRRDWRILTVEDEGPGVDADLWERVFERFQKLDPNSPGAGLGLAIVRQTARSLGGDARLIGAAAVEVVLPRPVAETGAAGRS